MLRLYEMVLDCGRHGVIESLFVATEEEVKSLYGKEAYFYEALGKHSEITWEYEESDFKVVEGIDNNTCEILVKALGSNNLSGHYPWDYLREEDTE